MYIEATNCRLLSRFDAVCATRRRSSVRQRIAAKSFRAYCDALVSVGQAIRQDIGPTDESLSATKRLAFNLSSRRSRHRMKPIRKAVFPVAGLGTRFLPATKAMPKEMLPVVDRPLIQHVVDEAREAGIEHFIFVTGRNKGVIEDHFDRQFELEMTLLERQKHEALDVLQPRPAGARLDQLHPPAGAARASATRCGARANWSATSRSRCCCRTCWCSTSAAAWRR